MKPWFDDRRATLSALVLILLAALGYGGWRFYVLAKSLKAARAEMASTTASLTQEVERLTQALAHANDQNIQLNDALLRERDRVDEISETVAKATETVGVLDKLQKTDPELLQKYSSVYFLNENYAPAKMTVIGAEKYLYDPEKPELIHADVWPHLGGLLEAARADGVELKIVSAFRSFDSQASLKSQYIVVYGSGANRFSADQGYSEHQLGTTVDFTTSEMAQGPLTGFETTPAYRWLLDNAQRFGFILSYPEDNPYFVFEPWHWRFVGRDLAQDLHAAGERFYDWDQRKIDEYLIKIFD